MSNDGAIGGAQGSAEAALETPNLGWDVRLTELQRIEAAPEEDDLEDLFSVTFAVDGPNAEAAVEIMVPDAADVEVVSVALDTLHGALLAWADLIRRRKEQLRAVLAEG